jgi:hypothetical protein
MASSPYECNICLETASEPVVTLYVAIVCVIIPLPCHRMVRYAVVATCIVGLASTDGFDPARRHAQYAKPVRKQAWSTLALLSV